MVGCLHREHEMKSASTSSLWERRAQKRWLPKTVLPCAYPLGISHCCTAATESTVWPNLTDRELTAPLWFPQDMLVA